MPYSRATSDAWAASSDVAEMKRVLRPGSRLLILDQVPDFDAFQQGEVLVARATAPAWTALVERAAAVVTDGAVGNAAERQRAHDRIV